MSETDPKSRKEPEKNGKVEVAMVRGQDRGSGLKQYN